MTSESSHTLGYNIEPDINFAYYIIKNNNLTIKLEYMLPNK